MIIAVAVILRLLLQATLFVRTLAEFARNWSELAGFGASVAEVWPNFVDI